MSHSPTPWTLTTGGANLCVYSPDGSVCVLSRSRQGGSYAAAKSEEQSVADAHLIAAAPDLLRELSHLVKLMEPVEDRLDIPGLATLNGARAAIAKAEGRTA